MWCLTLKVIWQRIKKMKHDWKLRLILFCPMDKDKNFPSYWMVYWKISWFEHNFLQNFHMVPKVYALSRSYLDCLEYFRFFPFYAKSVLWELYGVYVLFCYISRLENIILHKSCLASLSQWCKNIPRICLPWPGFEPGLSRPQREVLTTIRSRLSLLGCRHWRNR